MMLLPMPLPLRALVLLPASASLFGCATGAPPKPAPIVRADAPIAALPDGEPLLRMPFAAGEVVLCQQGNRSPKPLSHSFPNTFHALDLSAPGAGTVTVVAAAQGTVARIVTGSSPDAEQPGDGFGNLVVVDHGREYFTAYAHLDHVDVRPGDRVRAGARLGTMGRTGKAGNPHLHFSLHRGAGGRGLPETVPMRGLVVAERGAAGFEIALRSSLELTCSNATVTARGGLYGAETDPSTAPRFGPAPTALSRQLADRHAERMAATPVDLRGDWVNAEIQRRGAAAVRATLEQMQREHPRDPIVLYWLGVVLSRDLGADAEARAVFTRLDGLHVTEPPWIAPWVSLRLATLADAAGDRDEARARVRAVLAVTGQGADFNARRARLAESLGLVEGEPAPEGDAPIPACDATTATPPRACLAPGRGKRGLVVFLHGKFRERGDAATLALVTRRAEAAGMRVLALYGERGHCTWEERPDDFFCWPQEESQGEAARRVTRAWPALVARARRQSVAAGPTWLVGYSNGAFMASRALVDGLTPTFDGVAILLGGVRGPVGRSAGTPPRVVMLAGTTDEHHRVTAAEASKAFGEAGWAHLLRVRDGGHALTPGDVDWALTALARDRR